MPDPVAHINKGLSKRLKDLILRADTDLRLAGDAAKALKLTGAVLPRIKRMRQLGDECLEMIERTKDDE
jgi:hypothetical protein